VDCRCACPSRALINQPKLPTGDLLHIDTKRLGRIGPGGGKCIHGWPQDHAHRDTGWDFVHVAVDDATRLAYAEELPDERASTATAFLDRALAFFAHHGVEVHRVISDNAPCYYAHVFRDELRERGIKEIRCRCRFVRRRNLTPCPCERPRASALHDHGLSRSGRRAARNGCNAMQATQT
jgi:hypothetical protein